MDERMVEIKKRLKKKLDPARYEHTLGVAYTAACLAMRYGADVYQAEMAGLLHDCAKYLSDFDKLEKSRRHGIPISTAERKNPSLLHAKLGAYYAESKYGITDPAILEAIRCHTTGKANMSLLDKIIFIADYIEPDRCKAPDLDQIRAMAFVDLDKAVYAVLKGTIDYVRRREAVMDETTLSAFEYYEKRMKGLV